MTYLHTALSLGLLLQSEDTTIKRNAMSILKVLQRCDHKNEHGQCIYCFKPSRHTSPAAIGEPWCADHGCMRGDCPAESHQ